MEDSPTKDPRVTKAKRQIIFGLLFIVIIGLAISIYFVFLKTPTVDTTEPVVDSSIIAIANGAITSSCETNSDCILIDSLKDLSDCCPRPSCTDYEDPSYVAVSKQVYEKIRDDLVAEAECRLVDCLEYAIPECPETTVTGRVSCQKNICVKEII